MDEGADGMLESIDRALKEMTGIELTNLTPIARIAEEDLWAASM